MTGALILWSCEIAAGDRIGIGCASYHEVAAAGGMRHRLASSVASVAEGEPPKIEP